VTAQEIPTCHANCIKSFDSVIFSLTLRNALANAKQGGMKHVHWTDAIDSLIAVSSKLQLAKWAVVRMLSEHLNRFFGTKDQFFKLSLPDN